MTTACSSGYKTGYEGLAYPSFTPTPARFTQRANEILDYSIDFSGWLPDGDSIASSSWACDAGLVLSNTSYTSTTTTVWVSGGLPNHIFKVANFVTTVGGRVSTRELTFVIKPAPFPSYDRVYQTIHGTGALSATAVTDG
jgi:hypothetical protein